MYSRICFGSSVPLITACLQIFLFPSGQHCSPKRLQSSSDLHFMVNKLACGALGQTRTGSWIISFSFIRKSKGKKLFQFLTVLIEWSTNRGMKCRWFVFKWFQESALGTIHSFAQQRCPSLSSHFSRCKLAKKNIQIISCPTNIIEVRDVPVVKRYSKTG